MQRCSIEILPKMFDGYVSGMSRNVGRAAEEEAHASAACIGVARCDDAAASSTEDCNGLNAPEREERDISYALRREVNDEFIIVPVCEADYRSLVGPTPVNGCRNNTSLCSDGSGCQRSRLAFSGSASLLMMHLRASLLRYRSVRRFRSSIRY